jgi:hypothetical protein
MSTAERQGAGRKGRSKSARPQRRRVGGGLRQIALAVLIGLIVYSPLPAWSWGETLVSGPQTEVPLSLPGAERAGGTQARLQAA